MNPDPNDLNQLPNNPPDLQAARSKMGKEWLLVFGFVAVIILIAALTAWHLTQGH